MLKNIRIKLEEKEKFIGRPSAGGHSSKIGLTGCTLSPDGIELENKIQQSNPIRNPTRQEKESLAAARVRTGTFGLLVPQGKTELQLSALSLKCDSKFMPLFTEFMRDHRPNFTFTTVQVNINTISKPHVDGGNSGASVIVGEGIYTGGRTVLWPSLSLKQNAVIGRSTRDWQDSKTLRQPDESIDIHNQSLMFDGDKTWHASERFTGRRFSFVFFNYKPKIKKSFKSKSK